MILVCHCYWQAATPKVYLPAFYHKIKQHVVRLILWWWHNSICSSHSHRSIFPICRIVGKGIILVKFEFTVTCGICWYIWSSISLLLEIFRRSLPKFHRQQRLQFNQLRSTSPNVRYHQILLHPYHAENAMSGMYCVALLGKEQWWH